MTAKIVVAGVASLSMAVPVDGFPIEYTPLRLPAWMRSGVGGAGRHVARALGALGDEVTLCTVVGDDPAGAVIREDLRADGLLGPTVVSGPASSLNVALVGPDGRRIAQPFLAAVDAVRYPPEAFLSAMDGADLAVLTNTCFVRTLLPYARDLGVPVAVDVHVISDIDDTHNRPWLDIADVVFCSHERLPGTAVDWIGQVFERYPGCAIAAVGCGGQGCVAGLRDGTLVTVGAVAPRGVVSTVGAGDALFASFLHGWLATGNPVDALESAVLYAGWKVGDSAPYSVTLTEAQLSELRRAWPVRATVGRWDAGSPVHGSGGVVTP
jgi:sugar/nucleoside kinase (ribokinase family)